MNNELIQIVQTTFHDFLTGLPDIKSTVLMFILFFAWAYLCLKITSYLKLKYNIPTGLSRKSFHLLVFLTVAIINSVWGFSGVCLIGIIYSIFILNAVIKKKSSGLYLALARESDSPHSTLYVIIPYLSTLIGGILLNYYFKPYTILGYLICGLGDASGEVIGVLFGKNKFKVRLLNFHTSIKSIEGSTSILIVCFIICLLFTYNQFHFLNLTVILLSVVFALILTMTEIITPKGIDNLSMQLIAVIIYKWIIL